MILMIFSSSVLAKSIDLVVPWAPGGTTDQVAQIIITYAKPEFSKKNISLNITYRPGAGGLLGANHVAATEPGKTQLLLGGNTMISTAIINPGIASYDVSRDFVMLGYIGYIPMIMVVSQSSDIKNISDWKNRCKKRPLNYGTAGFGSNTHISSEIINSLLGCQDIAIPYKGAAPAVIDLLGDHLDYLSDYVSGVIVHIENNKLRPLVSLDRERLSELPDVPTIVELSQKDYDFYNWFIIAANSGADPGDIELAQKIFSSVLNLPEVKERLKKLGVRKQSNIEKDFLFREQQNFNRLLKNVRLR